jgi:ribosome-binding factor A
MKEFSTRQLKVGQEIKAILAEIFVRGDIYDPQTNREINITISEVQIAPDLANATVFFIPLAGKDKERTAIILNSISKKLKFYIGKQLHMKKIPELYFKLDTTFENAQKMNELIKNTKNDKI